MERKELEAKILENQLKRKELTLAAQQQQAEADERARRVSEFTEPYQPLRDRNRNLAHATQALIEHTDTRHLLVKLKSLEDTSSVYALVLFAGPHGLPFAKIDFFESPLSTEELQERQAEGQSLHHTTLHTDKTYEIYDEIYASDGNYDSIQRTAVQTYDASTFLSRKRFRKYHMQEVSDRLEGFGQSLALVAEAIDDPTLNPELAKMFEDKPAWTFLPVSSGTSVEA